MNKNRNRAKIRLKTTTTTNNTWLMSIIQLCLYNVNTRLLPHAKMLLVLMNCFLWRVNYALEENVSTEQMWIFLLLMYRSNRSFNMPPPPRANPRAFDFFENYCSNSPLPGPKCRSNAPHYGPFRWSNAPTPGTFHRHKTDRGTAETPSVVEQNLYKYNKTEKHC